MVSAVFHSPLDASSAADTPTADAPRASHPALPAAQAPKPPRPPIDWRAVWLRVLPPVLGLALLIGVA